MPGQFDLLRVRMYSEILHARPIEWSVNPLIFETAEPIRWETACPKCSQMMTFGVNDVVISPDGARVFCKCSPNREFVVQTMNDVREAAPVDLKSNIIDPIEAGIFDTTGFDINNILRRIEM